MMNNKKQAGNTMLQANPDNQEFLDAIIGLGVGDMLNVADGTLVVEAIFDVPTHFPWHQRIFAPGIILKKVDSRVRIYVEANKIGLAAQESENYDDRQIINGEVLPAEELGE